MGCGEARLRLGQRQVLPLLCLFKPPLSSELASVPSVRPSTPGLRTLLLLSRAEGISSAGAGLCAGHSC